MTAACGDTGAAVHRHGMRLARPSTPRRRRWRSRPMVSSSPGQRAMRSGCRLLRASARSPRAAAVPAPRTVHAPFFSPDGQWLGFFADGRLKKVALAGGAPVALADAPAVLGGTWIGSDIIFAGSPSGGLMRVSSDGGGAAPLTSPHESDGEVRHAWPAVVPGTRIVLFIIASHPSIDAPGKVGAFAFDPRSTLGGYELAATRLERHQLLRLRPATPSSLAAALSSPPSRSTPRGSSSPARRDRSSMASARRKDVRTSPSHTMDRSRGPWRRSRQLRPRQEAWSG